MPDYFVSRTFVPPDKPSLQQQPGPAILALQATNRRLESSLPRPEAVPAYYPPAISTISEKHSGRNVK